MNVYTISAVVHWVLPKNHPISHIYMPRDVLQDVLLEFNQEPGEVLFGGNTIGMVIPNSIIFRDGVFCMDISISHPIPNLINRLFCVLPISRSPFEDSWFRQREDGNIEARDICIHSVVVCDQVYRPDINLRALINRKDGDALEPITYATVASPDGWKLHRVYIDGSNWYLDTEMAERAVNTSAWWYPCP